MVLETRYCKRRSRWILLQCDATNCDKYAPHYQKIFVLRMEAGSFSETLVHVYETTRRHIPEDSSLYGHRRENVNITKTKSGYNKSWEVAWMARRMLDFKESFWLMALNIYLFLLSYGFRLKFYFINFFDCESDLNCI
jgi:hypothetical protein